MDNQTMTNAEILLTNIEGEEYENEEEYEETVDGRRRKPKSWSRSRPRPRQPNKQFKISELGANSFRKQALERLHLLPKDIQQGLLKGTLQLSDKQYYAVEDYNGNSVDIFTTDQAKSPGTSNFANSKLDHWFICSALRILHSDGSTSRFGDIMPKYLSDGELTMKSEKEWLQDLPIEAFSNAGNEITLDTADIPLFAVMGQFETTRPMGLFLLSNPKIIKPGIYNEMNVKLTGSISSGSIKGILIGTEIIPA